MTLRELGWRADESLPSMAQGEVLGRVAVEHRNAFALYTEAGEVSGEVSGRLRHHASTDAGGLYPVVGDWVVVRPHSGEAKGAIQAVLPRRTQFVRGAAGTEGVPQIVAANVDVVFLVSGLDGELNPRRIERYITLARDGGAQPVVVLNKADLCDDVDRERRRAAVAAVGVPVLIVSALEGTGVPRLEPAFIDDQTVAFLGSSGRRSPTSRTLREQVDDLFLEPVLGHQGQQRAADQTVPIQPRCFALGRGGLDKQAGRIVFLVQVTA
jgi:ribosome biogenesis GTPase